MPFPNREVSAEGFRVESESRVYGLFRFGKGSFPRQHLPENNVCGGVLPIDFNCLPYGSNSVLNETDLSVEAGKVEMRLQVLGVDLDGLGISPSGIVNPALSLIPFPDGRVGIRKSRVDLQGISEFDDSLVVPAVFQVLKAALEIATLLHLGTSLARGQDDRGHQKPAYHA